MSKVSAGGYFTLALAANGDCYSFGRNEYGENGVGSTGVQSSPLFVKSGITLLAAGLTHSLILSNESLVYSFGQNTVRVKLII